MIARKLPVVVLLLLMVLSLGACSFRFMYNHVDLALIWRIDDFLDLRQDQRMFLQDRLTRHLQWHRGEMVRWRGFLQEIQQRIDDGVDEAELDWFYNTLAELRNRLGRQLAADTAQLLATANDEQIDYMLSALAGENQEMEDRSRMSAAGRAEERGRMTIEGIEEWTGYLSNPQRKQVRALAAALPDVTEPWLAYRRQRQQQFVALARRAAAGEPVEQALYDWFTAPRPAQFQPFFDAVNRMALDVDKLFTDPQRHRIQEKLQDWIDDMDTVINEKSGSDPF